MLQCDGRAVAQAAFMDAQVVEGFGQAFQELFHASIGFAADLVSAITQDGGTEAEPIEQIASGYFQLKRRELGKVPAQGG